MPSLCGNVRRSSIYSKKSIKPFKNVCFLNETDRKYIRSFISPNYSFQVSSIQIILFYQKCITTERSIISKILPTVLRNIQPWHFCPYLWLHPACRITHTSHRIFPQTLFIYLCLPRKKSLFIVIISKFKIIFFSNLHSVFRTIGRHQSHIPSQCVFKLWNCLAWW